MRFQRNSSFKVDENKFYKEMQGHCSDEKLIPDNIESQINMKDDKYYE